MDAALLQEFVTEAEEHLEEMESFLLRLENDPSRKEFLNDIFRCIHTIKGASEFVGLEKISDFSHKLENLLDDLRGGKAELTEPIVTFLINGRDRLTRLVAELAAHGEEQSGIDDLLTQIDRLMADAGQPTDSSPDAEAEAGSMPLDTEFLNEDSDPAPDLLEPDAGQVNVASDACVEAAGQSHGLPEAPPAGTSVDAPVLPAGEESYEEEHDRELYQIFLDQLKDQLNVVQAQIDVLDQQNAEQGLNRCRRAATALRSSANYMGYEQLKTFLGTWIERIDATLSDPPVNAGVLAGFMQACVDQLQERFFSGNGDAPEAIEEDTALRPEREDNLNPDLSSGLSDAPAGDAAVDTQQDARSLKEKLSRAFDLFSDGRATPEIPPSSGAVRQVLFETLEEPVAENTTPAEQPPEQEKPAEMKAAPATPEAGGRIASPASARKTGRGQGSETAPATEQQTGKTPARPAANDADPSVMAGKKNMRVDTEKIDSLMNQVGELVVSRSGFSQLFIEMRELHQQLKEAGSLEQREMKMVRGLATKVGEATSALGRVVNDLQDSVMKIRMLPIAQLFNRYPRLVRDLVLNTGKKVRLEIKGEETELDKMIIEQMSDPLIHIIRNAVDHGIETAAERKRAGKPEQGLLELNAYHESNHVVIEIVDDGRGVDPGMIRAAARRKQFISEPELNRMSDKEVVGLVMRPGFSTAATVSHTSGRGVGMDVVKKNIEKLNGSIEIDSKVGVETRLRIKIPLTLAIISALLVKVGEKSFAIPLTSVEETLRIDRHQIATVEGFEVIHLRNRTLPLLRLMEIFDVPSAKAVSEKAYVVIVSAGQRRIGVLVDTLIGQEEVVIKPLADYLQEESTFSGATILGDGKISLIIDVEGLVNLAVRRHTLSRSGPLAFHAGPEKPERPVVEEEQMLSSTTGNHS